jgi:hypothetical protein
MLGAALSNAQAADLNSLQAVDPASMRASVDPPSDSATLWPLTPTGVFGANMPGAGHLVFTLEPIYLQKYGNLMGTTPVSAQYIVSHIAINRTPIPGYHLLRVVPTAQQNFAQAFSFAYGVTDDFYLFTAGAYLDKNVNLLTFKGLSGIAPEGTSTGHGEGYSDTVIAGDYRVYHDAMNQVNLFFGMSIPTGVINKYWTPLSPFGKYVPKVAVYGFEPGAGTFNALPGIVYSGMLNRWSWGLSYRADIPLTYNTDGYQFGAFHEIDAWGGYSWLPGLESTVRLSGTTQTGIHGVDYNRTGYAQGNFPGFYGGQLLDVFLGGNISGRYFGIPKATLSAEFGIPVYARLNGPQSDPAYVALAALKYKF